MTNLWSRRAYRYRPGDIRRDVLDDFENGNVQIDPRSALSIQDDTEALLHRIAFTVWHTALHIEVWGINSIASVFFLLFFYSLCCDREVLILS